jgi:hypothetical protein
MNSLEIISSMKTKSRKKYYDENAIEAYKNRLKSYNSKDQKDFGGIPYDYAVITPTEKKNETRLL